MKQETENASKRQNVQALAPSMAQNELNESNKNSKAIDGCQQRPCSVLGELDADGTPLKSPFRLDIGEIAAIIPSITNPKCATIILKSGYAFDIWKQTLGHVTSLMDSTYQLDPGYINIHVPNHNNLTTILPVQ